MKSTDDIANDVVQAVAELPDRASPEDWPEAMMVTGEELRAIVAARLVDEYAFNEGYQEHIAELLAAMRPFAKLVNLKSTFIPPGRLSFSNWRKLAKAYKAATLAMTADQKAGQ